jgi:pimeloyl-ACP methyl ester carboxylesterase
MAEGTAGPRDAFIEIGGGIRLSVRVSGAGDGAPILCIPGLTRNLKDFDGVAKRLSARGRRVFTLSLRGRGLSDYDPNLLNYHPLTYRDDVIAAMDALNIDRAIFIGTSLGGIVAMLTNAAAPGRVAAAILNDVGVRLAPEGVARILSYAAGPRPDAADLDDAAAQMRTVNDVAFPGRDAAFWRRFAERTYRPTDTGRWRLDYDPAIGEALIKAPPAPDLATAFAALGATPTLLLRGALSDLLTPPIVEEMRALHPNLRIAEIADVGHAPTLEEPDAERAIDAFLQSLG